MEYTTLEQVKIRLKQFHIDTVTNDDDTTSDVVVFDKKEDNPLIEQLIKESNEEIAVYEMKQRINALRQSGLPESPD